MPKVYLILTDGENVLVAEGGRSGKPQTPRRGYHLPGGRVEKSDKSYMETLQRELKEETGLSLRDPVQMGSEINPATTYGAKFIIVKTDSILDLVKMFNAPDYPSRPAIKNPYDEPFTNLVCLPLANCWKNENFNEKYYTDYFGIGLEEAAHIILKK